MFTSLSSFTNLCKNKIVCVCFFPLASRPNYSIITLVWFVGIFKLTYVHINVMFHSFTYFQYDNLCTYWCHVSLFYTLLFDKHGHVSTFKLTLLRDGLIVYLEYIHKYWMYTLRIPLGLFQMGSH